MLFFKSIGQQSAPPRYFPLFVSSQHRNDLTLGLSGRKMLLGVVRNLKRERVGGWMVVWEDGGVGGWWCRWMVVLGVGEWRCGVWVDGDVGE